VKTILEKNGFRVVASTNGRDGLAKLETERPDMVILDIMIPGVDGIEICRTIKSNPATAGIPVLMMSSMPENIRMKFGILELPGDGFVQKPIVPSEIIKEIISLFYKTE